VTTPEQQADLDKLLAAQQLVRLNNHNFMEHLMRMSPEDFKHAGFRNLEDGLIKSMTSATKKMKDLGAIYLKKWPDK
jgi:hypothetical protein